MKPGSEADNVFVNIGTEGWCRNHLGIWVDTSQGRVGGWLGSAEVLSVLESNTEEDAVSVLALGLERILMEALVRRPLLKERIRLLLEMTKDSR